MRAFHVPLALAVTLFVSATGSPQDRPDAPAVVRDRPAAPATGTSKLKGRILTTDGMPLRRAQVSVAALDQPVRRMVNTAADGSWEINALPAGRYTVSVSKPGFVTVQYGQRRPFESGTPIPLAAGQSLEQINMTLPRGGVITGRILDDNGDPVAQAQVQAHRYGYAPDGQRRLTTSKGTITDDLGQFRLFGLDSGDYAVSASVSTNPSLADTAGDLPAVTTEPLATTYYPGTTNPYEAQVVPLKIGEETSVQIQLLTSRVGRITGVVVNSEGKPLAGATLIIAGGIDGGLGGVIGTNADGTFTISNVSPGEHMISVRQSSQDATAEFADVLVSVVAEPVNVRIVTGKRPTLSGRVTWEGTSSRAVTRQGGIVIPGVNGPRVMLQPATTGPFVGSEATPGADGTIAEDGTFTLAGGSGRVFVRVAMTPPGWLVKSVTLDGKDITDVPLDLSGRTAIDDVRIVLTDKSCDLSGRVTDSRGTGLKEYVVVLLPAALPPGVSPQRFIHLVRPDQDGQFRAKALLPGRYTATALEWLEPGREFVPEFQDELRRQGKAVTLKEGEAATLDLKLSGL
jgi:protocatechuate 3,4-dioxygenase beta subunit